MFCKNCGHQLTDGSAFCNNCGAAQNAPAPQPAPVAPVASQQPAPVQPPVAPPPMAQMPQGYAPVPNPPQKKNKGVLIAIIVVLVIVLAGIGFAAEKIFQNQGYGDGSSSSAASSSEEKKDESNDDTSSDNGSTPAAPNGTASEEGVNSELNSAVETVLPSQTVAFEKGSVINGFYVNNWANIQFSTAQFSTIATDEELAQASNTEYSYGFNGYHNDGIYVRVIFEKSELTADEYLQTINETAVITDATIAGQNYRVIKRTENGDSQQTYARKINGYFVFLDFYGISEDHSDIEAFVAGITVAP